MEDGRFSAIPAAGPEMGKEIARGEEAMINPNPGSGACAQPNWRVELLCLPAGRPEVHLGEVREGPVGEEKGIRCSAVNSKTGLRVRTLCL